MKKKEVPFVNQGSQLEFQVLQFNVPPLRPPPLPVQSTNYIPTSLFFSFALLAPNQGLKQRTLVCHSNDLKWVSNMSQWVSQSFRTGGFDLAMLKLSASSVALELNEQRKVSYIWNRAKTISNGNLGTKEMINKKLESYFRWWHMHRLYQ